MAPASTSSAKRITILAVGSRGDVQPYVALARGLREAGHDVTLATQDKFRWLCEDLGIPHRELQYDPLLAYSRLLSFRKLLRLRAAWKEARSQFLEALDEWYTATNGAELIVAHPKVFVAEQLAALHNIRVVFAHTLPATCPTSEYPCSYVLARQMPAILNRFSYQLLPMTLAPLRRVASDWFANKGVATDKRIRTDLYTRAGTPIAHLHGHSESVLPHPRDWPAEWRVTGYWRTGVPCSWQPEADLVDFLHTGPPPVYAGFGSMVYRGNRKRFTKELVHPLLERGERVLLVRGWALDDTDIAHHRDIHFIDAYEGPWHSWLFERVKLVIHHGGPGTFGAALHAGRPQVCCPFAMDQPFWSRRAAALGVAPDPIPIREWSPRQWESKVTAVLDCPSYATQADALARRLRAEDGVKTAVTAIEQMLTPCE